MNLARRWTGRIVLILAVVGTIGCDQVTKHVATTTPSVARDRVERFASAVGGGLSEGAA